MTDAVRSMVHGSDYPEKGVRVTQEDGRLVIELHIAVSYGLNISTAAAQQRNPCPTLMTLHSLTLLSR
jgi:uncharacterized alkaline shock family protein YloU